MPDNLISDTENFVKEQLQNAEGGHDWWHIHRVRNNTLLLLETEKADPLVCELAALVHDIADHKFYEDEDLGPSLVKNFFLKKKLDAQKTEKVISIMRNISFSNSFDGDTVKSPELQVVQDADRLDAIGAIGIARTFNYGGFKNRPIYNPDVKIKSYNNSAEYTNSDSPTIHHFYEKLLLLKDRMNTKTGKKIAEERHEFMEQFLDRFYREWEGEC